MPDSNNNKSSRNSKQLNHINKKNQVNGGNTVAAHNGIKNQNKSRKPDTEALAPSTKKQKTVEPTGNFY